MSERVHTCPAECLGMSILTNDELVEMFGEDYDTIGIDEPSMVLEDPGNGEAWVLTGTPETWHILGRDIISKAQYERNTHALRASIVDGSLYFHEDVNETLATILDPDELGDWLDTASTTDPTGKIVAGVVMLTDAIPQECGNHDATVIVYTDGTLSWCVLPLAE